MTFTIKNPMPPLWLMYPYIEQSSAGWRFGYGAEYKWDLADWQKTLSEKDLETWGEFFPPPVFWQNDHSTVIEKCEWISIGESEIPVWKSDHSLAQLQLSAKSGLDYLFFLMSRNAKEDDIVGTDCFSKWFQSKFSIGTQEYWCVEQYMLAQKARFFADEETYDSVIAAVSTSEIQNLSRKVKGFDKVKWNLINFSVLVFANYHKFIQNADILRFLLKTGDKIIVQASPNDCIWGNGLSADDSAAANPGLWRGQNLMGFALMTARDELRRICGSYDLINWEDIYLKYLK